MTDSSDDETRAPSGEPADAGFRVSSAVLVVPDGARYEKGEELARGGLGTIATATDRKLQRAVAIKELHERTEGAKARFVREGLVVAKLQHPAIVPILDAGTWEASGDPFLVMKLLEGKTLAEELAVRTTAEARLALVPSLLAIADALGYAHERGIVHRDVKPANIMIGMHGETVLLDWGLAFDTGDANARVEVAGTPRFMSAAHARGDRPTPAFDVFAFGITLDQVIGDARAPDLAAIAAKARSREPYVDGAALAADLRKLLAGQLVGARRYTRAQLMARWVRRNKLAVAIAGAAAIALGVVGAIAVRSVVDERDAANARRAEAEARAQDLVLAQARANLRSDPTATIAWLAQYPIDAPHQDEVLALVDEAAGRGVARHVWRPSATPADAAWTPDGHAVVTVYATGELWRDDVTTGAHVRLAAIDRPLDSVLARGDAIFALDRDGGIWRWRPKDGEHFARYAQVPVTSRTSGLYLAGDELKVTYADDVGMYVDANTADTPHPRPQVPAAFDFAFSDDENDATSLYAVSPAGELALVDPASATPFRPLGTFAPHTWVRSSTDGKRYAAVVPGATDVAVWAAAAASAPVQIATTRRCATGEDLEEDADVGDDGKFVAVRRCGELAIYDVPGKQRVPLAQPERIEYFELANAGGWIAIGRDGGLQLLDLESGESRLLAGGDVAFSKYAPARDLVVSVGAAHGVRAWPMVRIPAMRLGAVAAPARLAVAKTSGAIAVARHLECAEWRPGAAAPTATFGVREARSSDDDDVRWPWDVSADGHECVFAAPHGAAVIAFAATVPVRAELAPIGDDALVQCVVMRDGDAVCRTEKHALRAFAPSGEPIGAPRQALGVVRALVRSDDRAFAIVERPDACAIEEATIGETIAQLPAGCRDARASGPGVVITRTNAIDVWTPAHGVTSVPLDTGIEPKLVEIEPDGARAAMVHEGRADVWDLATRSAIPGPTPHARAITALAWSGSHVLATVDAETVHLWDATNRIARVVFAEHVVSLAWAEDGKTLYTTDGLAVRAHAIDLARGATPREVRARIEALTSARIVDGKPTTPSR